MPSPVTPAADDPARRFRICVEEILDREAGYVDHPRDPGRCTNMGITIATLADWRGRLVTCADVRALTELEARQIYRARYWNSVQGDSLPAGIDLMVFDGAVNSGPAQSAKWLQEALRVEADGAIGPITLAALREANDRAAVINRICNLRIAFLRELRTWRDFGRGWTNRVDTVRAIALALAGA
ncbi:glycoside hydrolase family 108 protein [Roseomonas sp. HJA6]|uniref:Glycoside hydrolase family 108 protein n=1 Tax=Roseomonas alba TaxID=2846776 RepID=A0ABS7AID3_9PROT|nr:glycoside hydrolase family 108 protein [Neoroseomonas alba]MBW6402061.1 glycoside hydrolase family 108 protein [Neoroseomonas alba]